MSIVKNIFVVRHGHADLGAGLDFERKLTEKGRQAVTKTAFFIKDKCNEKNFTIDLSICSSALRTQQTTEILCDINNINRIQSYSELYSTVVSQWVDKISQVNEKNIIIIGHNPTFSQFLNNLCGYEVYMKPAQCAFITLEFCDDGIIYPATLIDYFSHE